jgi:hypothetical protein
MMRKFLGGIAALIVISLTVNGQANAQNNLLQNPGFETGGDYNRVVTDPIDNSTNFDVPPNWGGWAIVNQPGEPEWKNRVPTGFPHTGLFKIEGGRSFHISRGYATFTTATHQQVIVPDKANVRGSARGFMERGRQGEATPGGSFRVGIDPNGGTNPLDPAVIWSTTVNQDDNWVQATVDATANGTRVTLFLYATQGDPTDPNGIYWDDASLVVGGGGGTSSGGTALPGSTAAPTSPPVPTPQPFANFVAPQAPRDDGSIVHIVGEGDTFNSILVAYGVTQAEVLALNNLSAPPRFLQIGQRLVIRTAAPGGGSSSEEIAEQQEDEEETSDATEESEASTDEAQPTARNRPTEEADTESVETEEPAAETEEAQPTNPPVASTDAPPAPVTQVAQVAQNTNVSGVCVSMFDDSNRNRIREQSETLLAEGVITLSANGETLETYTTDGSSEPFCVQDLAAGLYTAVAQAPDGYGLTTSPQLSVRVQSGVAVNTSFGAAQGVEAIVPPAADSGDEAPQAIVEQADDTIDPILQNLGLIVFGLAGVVLVLGMGTALILRRR